MPRRLVAIVASLALSLALAGPAFGASQAATATTSAAVNATLSMSGVPAAIAFGTGIPSQTLTAPTFSIVVASTDPFTVTANASNMSGGSWVLAAVAMRFTINGGAPITPPGAGDTFTIGTTTPLVTSISLILHESAHSGTYAGTITFVASTN